MVCTYTPAHTQTNRIGMMLIYSAFFSVLIFISTLLSTDVPSSRMISLVGFQLPVLQPIPSQLQCVSGSGSKPKGVLHLWICLRP